MPKGNPSGYQTKNSPATVHQTAPVERGERKDPPKGAQQPGAGMKNAQTRNSRPNRA